MKKVFTAIAVCFLFAVISGNAHADLDSLLSDLNYQAKTDRHGFHASLSRQFDIPLPDVRGIADRVMHPADIFMCLQLGKMTGQSPERVLRIYQDNKGKGWGVVAKELGVKPGSADFHALKRGDLYWSGGKPDKSYKGKGKSNGNSKGKGKGKDKGKKGKKHDK